MRAAPRIRRALLAACAVALADGCGAPPQGSVAATVRVSAALVIEAERVRLSVLDGAEFSCALVHGERPDPLARRLVLPIDREEATVQGVPAGPDRMVVVDLLGRDAEPLAVGCAEDIEVVAGEQVEIEIEVHPYPRVIATTPAPGARHVSPTPVPAVTFSVPMDPDTLDATALRLRRDPEGEQVFVRAVRPDRLDETGRRWLLEVPLGLELGGSYVLEVGDGDSGPPESAAGLPLREGTSTSFAVAEAFDLDRDLSGEFLRIALGDDCGDEGFGTLAEVVERLIPVGDVVTFGRWPHVVTDVRVVREPGGQRVLDRRLDVDVRECDSVQRRDGTVIWSDKSPDAERLCDAVVETEVVVRECFCEFAGCDGAAPPPACVQAGCDG